MAGQPDTEHCPSESDGVDAPTAAGVPFGSSRESTGSAVRGERHRPALLGCRAPHPCVLAHRPEGDPSHPAPMVAGQWHWLWTSPDKGIVKCRIKSSVPKMGGQAGRVMTAERLNRSGVIFP